MVFRFYLGPTEDVLNCVEDGVIPYNFEDLFIPWGKVSISLPGYCWVEDDKGKVLAKNTNDASKLIIIEKVKDKKYSITKAK